MVKLRDDNNGGILSLKEFNVPNPLELQKSFYEAIFHNNECSNFISSAYPFERLNIYRQTIFENMRNALQITFPGVWKLLGAECANAVAFAFCKVEKNLPRTGCLGNFGESFPGFLGSLKELDSLPYLADYALYEWLKHKAYEARETTIITSSDLQNIPESKIEYAVFSFIPSCLLFTSKYPIYDINEIVDQENAEAINLNNTPSYGIVARPQDEVITFFVSKGLWEFINYLMKGFSILQSIKAMAVDSDFNLSEGIAFLLQKQLVHKITFLQG